MYKVKIFTVTLALMAIFGAAQAQNRSQGITPQQIIEQSPDFPSVETLVLENMYSLNADDLYGEPFRAKVERAWNEVKDFRDNIDALRQRGTEAARAQDAAMRDNARREGNRLADNTARQQTGRSVKQLQNMSDREAEAMAGDLVQQRLAAAGLGNMTLEDLEALEGKSDEEILQAMQGVKIPTQAATPQQGGGAQVDAALKRITDRWAAIDREIIESMPEVAEVYQGIYDERRVVLTQQGELAAKTYEAYMNGEATKQQSEAAQRGYDGVKQDYLTVCYTTWRGHVAWMCERVAAKMADVAEYDRLMAQKMSAAGMGGTARQLPSAGYQIAGEYLDTLLKITTPPIVAAGSGIRNNS